MKWRRLLQKFIFIHILIYLFISLRINLMVKKFFNSNFFPFNVAYQFLFLRARYNNNICNVAIDCFIILQHLFLTWTKTAIIVLHVIQQGKRLECKSTVIRQCFLAYNLLFRINTSAHFFDSFFKKLFLTCFGNKFYFYN